jgi:hypothetical protein
MSSLKEGRIRRPWLAVAAMALAGVLGAPAPAAAQQGTWVFFADKGLSTGAETEAAVSALAATYDPRAMERRQLRGVSGALLDAQDLPVATAYLNAVLTTGVTLRTSIGFANAVSIVGDEQQLAAIRALPFVTSIRPVAVGRPAYAEPVAAQPQTAAGAGAAGVGGAADFYGQHSDELSQIRIPQVHAMGHTGSGVLIGVMDTGFTYNVHEAFTVPGHALNVVNKWDFVGNDADVSDGSAHGTEVLGIIGGYKPNTYVGGAYNASFLLARTEDNTAEYRAEEDYWAAGVQWFESQGADVVTSSLGYIDWYTQGQLRARSRIT